MQKNSSDPAFRLAAKLPRNYKTEQAQATLRIADKLVAIRESAEANTLGEGKFQEEWILISRALCDCPLPYRPTKQRQITKRTRFAGKWVSITYTCARPGVDMPYGADARMMHWLIDRAVQEGRRAVKQGRAPSREVGWNSTYAYFRDLGMTDGEHNYRAAAQSFRRLSGLAITIEIQSNNADPGKIIPFLEHWYLPKSIDKQEKAGQEALPIERYSITISEPLFKQAMQYLVTIPRPIWKLTKGKAQKGAMLLWAFVRAWAASGLSLVTWDVLREQMWYDESNPRRIKQRMKQTEKLLKTMWPGAKMMVTAEGVAFDKATEYLLRDDPTRNRVRRQQIAQDEVNPDAERAWIIEQERRRLNLI